MGVDFLVLISQISFISRIIVILSLSENKIRMLCSYILATSLIFRWLDSLHVFYRKSVRINYYNHT